jgi:NAD(P)-dependent dehydrogenase (short-subunit alcohol dehydrogenase family)
MDLELAGKVVLVTGGSKGIGLACAQRLAAEGARVAICSRSAANLEAAQRVLQAAGREVATFTADVGDPAAAERLAGAVESGVGPVDVLVNCAGAAKRYAPAELDMKAWHDGMAAKYFPYVHAMQAVLPRLAARGRGVVVNVVGQGGKVAAPTHLPGGAANAALMLATAGLASAYGPRGVRVVAVNPGRTLTDRAQGAFEAEARRLGTSVEEVRRTGEQALPLRRFARPEEVADVVAFLASARASYVTGVMISMDGGGTPTIV